MKQWIFTVLGGRSHQIENCFVLVQMGDAVLCRSFFLCFGFEKEIKG